MFRVLQPVPTSIARSLTQSVADGATQAAALVPLLFAVHAPAAHAQLPRAFARRCSRRRRFR